jgi:hypothetical protein
MPTQTEDHSLVPSTITLLLGRLLSLSVLEDSLAIQTLTEELLPVTQMQTK